MVFHAHELKYFHHSKLSHEWKPDGDNPWVEIHETFLKEDPQSMNKICIKHWCWFRDMSCSSVSCYTQKNFVNSEGEAWQIGKSPFLFAHPWGTTSPSRWRWALWSQRFETSSDRHQQITRRRWQTTVVVVVVDFFCGIQERRKQSKTINPAWSGSLLIMISMIFFNEFHMIDTSSLCSFIGEYSVSKTVEFIKMLGFLDARLISRHPAQRDAEHRFGGPRTN